MSHTTRRVTARLGKEGDPLSADFPLNHEQVSGIVLDALVKSLLALDDPKINEVLSSSGIVVYEDVFLENGLDLPQETKTVWPATTLGNSAKKARSAKKSLVSD